MITIISDKQQYQAQGHRRLKLIWGVTASILLLVGFPVSSQEASTPTPTYEITSLIEGDTCAPPCWFGLAVGESTSEDVIQMFTANGQLFANDLVEVGRTSDDLPIVEDTLNLQSLLDGKGIEFWWRSTSRKTQRIAPNYIDIENDIVSSIRIEVNDDVSLGKALEHLDQPSTIRATIGIGDVKIIF
jgi:hypothetical protein